MTRTAHLLALADAATPGPWEWINPDDDSPWDGSGYASLRTVKHYGEDKTEVRDGLHYTTFSLPKFLVEAEQIESVDDAAFIAAANPETIKQMCLREQKLVKSTIMLKDALSAIARGCNSSDPASIIARDALEAFNKWEGE